MVLKKDSLAIIDMIAIRESHLFKAVAARLSITVEIPDRNPVRYPDPHVFKPSRWYGVSEHDFTMFGRGPRSCIGRKFGQTEAVTFMALFLRDWHIDVVLENGETRDEYEARVMGKAGLVGMSFGVAEKVNLKLTKRNRNTMA